MTTNIERAAEVLRDDKHYKMGPHGEQFLTSEAARSLADAGLLKPDQPMAEEVEYRIVDPDTNGGRYEMRRWVRGVTEWRLDND